MDETQFAKLLEAFQRSQIELVHQLLQSKPGGSTHQSSILIPPFENFNSSRENFKMYRQRFENYLTMKGVFEDKMLCSQMLLNSIGPSHYQLIISLISPKKPTELSYDELIKCTEDHLCPKKNVLVAQHTFLSTYQQENQTIASYVAQLRRDIDDCDFVCTCKSSIANTFLRAQFIRGLRDNSIRENILQSDASNFDDIVKKALAIEASKLDSRLIGNKQPSTLDPSPSSPDVNKISRHHSRSNQQRDSSRSRSHSNSRTPINYKHLGIDDLCIRCGRNSHRVKDCWCDPKALRCNSCLTEGHVQKVCIKTLLAAKKSQKTSNSTNAVEDLTSIQAYGIYNIVDIFENCHINNNDASKYFVTVGIEGHPQKFEVDSGAGFTLLPRSSYQNLKLNKPLQKTNLLFRSYTQNVFVPDGKLQVKVQFKNRTSIEDLYDFDKTR